MLNLFEPPVCGDDSDISENLQSEPVTAKLDSSADTTVAIVSTMTTVGEGTKTISVEEATSVGVEGTTNIGIGDTTTIDIKETTTVAVAETSAGVGETSAGVGKTTSIGIDEMTTAGIGETTSVGIEEMTTGENITETDEETTEPQMQMLTNEPQMQIISTTENAEADNTTNDGVEGSGEDLIEETATKVASLELDGQRARIFSARRANTAQLQNALGDSVTRRYADQSIWTRQRAARAFDINRREELRHESAGELDLNQQLVVLDEQNQALLLTDRPIGQKSPYSPDGGNREVCLSTLAFAMMLTTLFVLIVLAGVAIFAAIRHSPSRISYLLKTMSDLGSDRSSTIYGEGRSLHHQKL